MARIAVFGAGYAGLVTGVCFAELGHTVAIRDIVAEKIDRLRAGRAPIYEPGLEELMERNDERLSYTLDVRQALEGADFLFVCVGTPPTYSGDADLSAVWSVIDALPQTRTRAILVMKSTVPVGTGEKVRAALDARGLTHVGYVSCPEFLAEGTAVRDCLHPDRVVVGAFEETDAAAVEALHERLGAEVVRTDVASAEMVKLAANAYLGTRISFINEIANVCELVGADVVEVARGMGLDKRIGTHYLRAGIGFGGSCLVGEETVLVRRDGRTSLVALERLFEGVIEDDDARAAFPENLEVLSWRDGAATAEFLSVAALTRRRYVGDIIEIRTKMGRRLRCTPDHPFFVTDGFRTELDVVEARALTAAHWLPIVQGGPAAEPEVDRLQLAHALEPASLERADVLVRTVPERIAALPSAAPALELDEEFWRIAGLYIAEGHCSADGPRRRLRWSFHPSEELDLVEKASRYEQRVPDLIWSAPESHKRALLAGLWRGDGSWSYVTGGPSVVLEYGTVSRELADGILRLLGDLGVVGRLEIGRTARSTVETFWIVVSGAAQVERLLDLVPERDRHVVESSVRRQAERIAPTGYRRHDANTAWVRVTDVRPKPFDGYVYSLEVPDSNTFVATHGLVAHNCFPKDISFLKLLAGNSGYHFQLLNAVIEVNELQKRRVVSKLQKHLETLRGKRIALLGLAFKPNTDDMREAPSIVLGSRLLAEGVEVRAWDPVVNASDLLPAVTIAETALEALEGADAAVVVTEWPELRTLDWAEAMSVMRNPLVIDGRNLLDAEALRSLGFVYEGVGRVSSPFEALPETEERELSR